MPLGIGEVAVGHRHLPAALGREVVHPAGGPLTEPSPSPVPTIFSRPPSISRRIPAWRMNGVKYICDQVPNTDLKPLLGFEREPRRHGRIYRRNQRYEFEMVRAIIEKVPLRNKYR